MTEDELERLFDAAEEHEQAGRWPEAADAWGSALEVALRGGATGEALGLVVEARNEALRRAGREPGDLDRIAHTALARGAAQSRGTPVAVPWLGAAAFAHALERWPGFAEWREDGHQGYTRELDQRMRAMTRGGVHFAVVELDVAAVEDYAAREGLDPTWAETRAQAAAEALRTDPAARVPWPPGRNDACWCGSGAKYKRCCGV